MTKKRFVLEGRLITSLDAFYDQIENQFGPFGRNLDALVDVLRGGFGAHKMGEDIVIEWRQFGASARFENKRTVVEILETAPNVEFLKR